MLLKIDIEIEDGLLKCIPLDKLVNETLLQTLYKEEKNKNIGSFKLKVEEIKKATIKQPS
ncbi:MAG TPA: hypothetical protein VIK72_19630 [Clostridiaceae bacterium]